MSFEEILNRMANADDYIDLYDAALLIVDDDLRTDVEQLIEQCEMDGDDVEVAYSVVASDLLDSHITELNESEISVSFEEILNRMANADDYSDLYDAALLIANDGLRTDVEQLIGQCEMDGDDVEVAYSVVASDLLDSHVTELNESVDTDLDEIQQDKMSDYIQAFEDSSNDKDLLNVIDEMDSNKNIPDEMVVAIRQLFRNNRFMTLNNKVDTILKFINANSMEESKVESLTESVENDNVEKADKDIEEAIEDAKEDTDNSNETEIKPDTATLNKLKDRIGQQMSVGELNSFLQGMLEQHNELFLLKSDLMNMDLDRTQELVIEDDGGNFILSYDIVDAGKGLIHISDVSLEEQAEEE